jgi:hypothetical protein
MAPRAELLRYPHHFRLTVFPRHHHDVAKRVALFLNEPLAFQTAECLLNLPRVNGLLSCSVMFSPHRHGSPFRHPRIHRVKSLIRYLHRELWAAS